MSLFAKLAGMFRRDQSPFDQGLRKCYLEGDQTLMYEFGTFFKSYEATGTKFSLTDKDLPDLEEVLDSVVLVYEDPKDREPIYTGAAVFFGTLVAMNLGGEWSPRENGQYTVRNLSSGNQMNPFDVVRTVVQSDGNITLRNEYEKLKNAWS